MSEMVHYIITNETVSMQQYANNSGSGWGVKGYSPPEAETLKVFGCSMEAATLPAF